MQQEIAKVVYPVLHRGLALKEELNEGGDPPDMAAEQATLKHLLKSAPGEEGGLGGRGAFLGIRYALACWLDEIFILDSPWRDEWREKSLEVDLYQSRERAHHFWTQAEMAEVRADTDALEVFFLCAMLGFRGDLRDTPERLKTWRDAIEARVMQSQEKNYTGPTAVPPRVQTAPLEGAQRKQRMLMAAGISLLLLIPFVLFFVVSNLASR